MGKVLECTISVKERGKFLCVFIADVNYKKGLKVFVASKRGNGVSLIQVFRRELRRVKIR